MKTCLKCRDIELLNPSLVLQFTCSSFEISDAYCWLSSEGVPTIHTGAHPARLESNLSSSTMCSKTSRQYTASNPLNGDFKISQSLAQTLHRLPLGLFRYK